MQELPQQAFKEEAVELLSELEDSLLELEEQPDDMDIIGKVFRAMHTLKGSGAMFGFTEIATFTHEVETVFDLVRNNELAVNKHLVDLSLQARDHITSLLNSEGTLEGQDRATGQTLIDQFKELSDSVRSSNITISTSTLNAPPVQSEQLKTYRIQFKPHLDILHNGTNIANVLKELASLGTCRIVAHRAQLLPLDRVDPENCYVSWDSILTTTVDEDGIRDVFIFVEDDCDLSIVKIDTNNPDEDQQRLGNILIERGEVTQQDIDGVLANSKKIGELLVEANLVNLDQIESALAEQQEIRKLKENKPPQVSGSNSLRVPAERLDELVNLVGEMVTVQSRLSQTAKKHRIPELQAIAEEVERLTEELRDNTLNIRMVQIGTTFSKFKRLVRDISNNLNKQVELLTVGAETELDKTVIDQLNDPLIHIIRNSMDHGIEMPEQRLAAGKPEQGSVTLTAEQSGDSVLIEIRDDGKGLDASIIREKAITKGLIKEDDELTDQEIFALIFAPGFSTAQQVTGLSGRGVGMDVVKRAIEALRGSITLNSQLGQGTTVQLRIPLTLAIIESLLVELGDEHFVLPLSAVEECIELTNQEIEKAHGGHLVQVRGELIPYIPLRQTFSIEGSLPAIQQVVITNIDGQRLGFVVDAVVGEHQTVIKSLGPVYRDVPISVSGATILGDGSVALILDIAKLMQQQQSAMS